MTEKSNCYENLIIACQADLKIFFKKPGPIYFVDDDSIFSQFYSHCLDKNGSSYQRWTPRDFSQSLSSEVKIEGTLFLPGFHFRIFNLNFDKRQKIELGKPYWVHISSNQSRALKRKLSLMFEEVLLNPLEELPSLFKSYLQHEDLLRWLHLDSCAEYHNDRLERNLLSRTLELQGLPASDLYKKSAELGAGTLEDYLQNELNIPKGSSYRHIPLHRLYQRVLNQDLAINLFEREIYGEVR